MALLPHQGLTKPENSHSCRMRKTGRRQSCADLLAHFLSQAPPDVDENVVVYRSMSSRRGTQRSMLWGNLRGERLHRDFSIPHYERVSCEFIEIVCCFSTPDQIGIITLEDCGMHFLRRAGFSKLREQSLKQCLDFAPTLQWSCRGEQDRIRGIIVDNTIDVTFAETSYVVIDHILCGDHRLFLCCLLSCQTRDRTGECLRRGLRVMGSGRSRLVPTLMFATGARALSMTRVADRSHSFCANLPGVLSGSTPSAKITSPTR